MLSQPVNFLGLGKVFYPGLQRDLQVVSYSELRQKNVVSDFRSTGFFNDYLVMRHKYSFQSILVKY